MLDHEILKTPTHLHGRALLVNRLRCINTKRLPQAFYIQQRRMRFRADLQTPIFCRMKGKIRSQVRG